MAPTSRASRCDEELERIARAGLAYPPSERWAYSVAMDVLGAVLEVAESADLERRS